MTYIYTIQ